MEYLSIQDFSEKWNISKRRIQVLCKEGRIDGVKKLGNMWVIPENTQQPCDARIKSPIKRENISQSLVRKELKKILNKFYTKCSNQGIVAHEHKDYILSIIASSLLAMYLDIEIDDKILNRMYKDISGMSSRVKFDFREVREIEKFVYKYRFDEEIDNLLSWAYQYSNKYLKNDEFAKTQFFTEKYMVDFLVNNIGEINTAKKILDPCVGGGNFLVECLEKLCDSVIELTENDAIDRVKLLYGYDMDNKITRIAVVNIKLKTISILKRRGVNCNISIWNNIEPNIFMSIDEEKTQGSLSKEKKQVVNVATNKKKLLENVLKNADVVITNPPFASVKGMPDEQKEFLKREYPMAKCDTCVAFLQAIEHMLSKSGICGIVSQSAWMHLKSFDEIRRWIVDSYNLRIIANLGSGSFQDLSGEKSSVSLLVLGVKSSIENNVKIMNINANTYEEKIKKIKMNNNFFEKRQSEINGQNGFIMTDNKLFEEISKVKDQYISVAVPMQGTSTGNAKELVGYFWEHFGDKEWIRVSNGGGYCRWKGLNNAVVKWGNNGEYIKKQDGSALRNVKYFPETQMVFSDTGTAGLNVRLLCDKQIFIASGPGIRVKKGNPYAHMALLNSRLASYCLKIMSPKLTIAAGYIGKIPTNEKIVSSVVLEKNAKLCVELKNKLLSTRTNNLEYNDKYIYGLPKELDNAAWYLFNEDITYELMKLEIESSIDECIYNQYGIFDNARKVLDESVGICAYQITENEEVNLEKLDKYLDKLLDANCYLKRTRNSKNSLGSDGYLEYISKDLGINPKKIVKKIQENPKKLKKVLLKYKNLILHNYVLYCMKYDTNSGVKRTNMKVKEIELEFIRHFEKYDFSEWIKNSFNRIHKEIFKGVPYLIYNEGEIFINDKLFKESSREIHK